MDEIDFHQFLKLNQVFNEQKRDNSHEELYTALHSHRDRHLSATSAFELSEHP